MVCLVPAIFHWTSRTRVVPRSSWAVVHGQIGSHFDGSVYGAIASGAIASARMPTLFRQVAVEKSWLTNQSERSAAKTGP